MIARAMYRWRLLPSSPIITRMRVAEHTTDIAHFSPTAMSLCELEGASMTAASCLAEEQIQHVPQRATPCCYLL